MKLASAVAIIVLSAGSAARGAQEVDIVGSWRGTSLCVDKEHFPACRDEQVIYDARPKGSARDTVTIRADKIVNGGREFMAEFDFSRTRIVPGWRTIITRVSAFRSYCECAERA